MKILVISLLRLGDVVMSTGILRLLREKHPGAEIHLLINQQFQSVGEMITGVDRVLTFDRKHLQEGLGDASRPIFDAYERLREFVEDLNEENYDLVVNLTQNKLSGYLLSLLEAKNKQGLSLDTQGRADFGSVWFRYLNRQIDCDVEGVFHHTDIFNFALESGSDTYGPTLQETEAGRAEADKWRSVGRSYIVVQALSSDVKKDWRLPAMRTALALFMRSHSDHDVIMLAGPGEFEKLQSVAEPLAAEGLPIRVAECSLAGAYSLIAGAELLLTVDTSIKHLASATGTKVIELSIGSSDYRRTGAYAQDAVIVQSREVCAPCPHSKPCHRNEHYCSGRISPELVAMLLSTVLTRQMNQLETLAEEYSDQVEILRTELKAGGFWAALPVHREFSESSVVALIDLCAWKIFLNHLGQEQETLTHFGAESVRLSRLLRRQYPEIQPPEWKHVLSDIERQIEGIEARFLAIDSGLKTLHAQFENPDRVRDFINTLIGLRDRIRPMPAVRLLGSGLDALIDDEKSPAFMRLRKITETMSEIQVRAEIEKKVVRALGQLMEAP